MLGRRHGAPALGTAGQPAAACCGLPTVIPSVSSKLLRFVAKGNDAGKESSNFKVSFSGSLLQGLTMAMEDEGQAKEIPLATA